MSTEGATGSATPNIDGIQHLLPVKPPRSFDFAKHEEWPRWIKRFDRYRIVSGLHKRNEELQVNAFLYAMGGEAEDIMSSFAFAEATDAMKYDVVKAKFDKYFAAKKNVNAKFNHGDESKNQFGGLELVSKLQTSSQTVVNALSTESLLESL